MVVLTQTAKWQGHHFEDMLRMEHEAGCMTPAYEGAPSMDDPPGLWSRSIRFRLALESNAPSHGADVSARPGVPAVHMRFWLAKQTSLWR